MYKKLIDYDTKQEAKIVQRTSDGAFIPFAEDNTDYQAYLAWLAEGGVPQEADDVSSQ